MAVMMMKILLLGLALTPVLLVSEAMDIHQLKQLATRDNVTCILVFGDSSVDPGNNNRLPTTIKSNFHPYGKDFVNGLPTGRFCDGRLATDFIADAFGFTNVIPAFLDPNIKKADLLHGISFASAGSGYDDLTANLSTLYKLGARRLVVVGVPPLGCMPLVKTLMSQKTCVESYNELAFSFNAKIKEKLVIMKKTIGLKTGYLDCYNIIQDAVIHPLKYGPPVLLSGFLHEKLETDIVYVLKMACRFNRDYKGCCATGIIEYGDTCKDMSTCDDASKYVFWDAVHPTQKMYQIIAQQGLQSLDERLFF
ncbi:hypothetical protein JRO89_XS06G0059600 [Xanthoceras sorbifolium]|uniref:GDSL esterase/lipase n=1 Tax=Xanthoceras sorbifolium TaxID=99658 RepID=A0ABQ8HX66_9ROSI|nr:hypothetical protein JRO89_XS06G0059600 [Xanthoceras sorbifolium]